MFHVKHLKGSEIQMMLNDKDIFRVIEAKKREILDTLEEVKRKSLKELSNVNKETMSRMRQLLADFNRLDFALSEKYEKMCEENERFRESIIKLLTEGNEPFSNSTANLYASGSVSNTYNYTPTGTATNNVSATIKEGE